MLLSCASGTTGLGILEQIADALVDFQRRLEKAKRVPLAELGIEVVIVGVLAVQVLDVLLSSGVTAFPPLSLPSIHLQWHTLWAKVPAPPASLARRWAVRTATPHAHALPRASRSPPRAHHRVNDAFLPDTERRGDLRLVRVPANRAGGAVRGQPPSSPRGGGCDAYHEA